MARRHREMNLWWGVIRRKLMFRSPSSSSRHNHHDSSSTNTIIVLHTNNGISFGQDFNSSTADDDQDINNIAAAAFSDHFVSREDIAAITIQACFRGHLGRRAYRALRSLVKLQAVVRGVVVRRQARIALHCMYALARLQITIRARQLHLLNS